MKIIEYQGFDNKFIGLGEENDKYYIIYGKTGDPTVSIDESHTSIYGGFRDVKILDYCPSRSTNIIIPFIATDKTLLYLMYIENKEYYKTVLTVLKDLS